MAAYLHAILFTTAYILFATTVGCHYLQRCAEGKGCCGYHASASGARQLKVAYFFYFLYVSKLEERRERGLRRTGEPCCFLFCDPKTMPQLHHSISRL